MTDPDYINSKLDQLQRHLETIAAITRHMGAQPLTAADVAAAWLNADDALATLAEVRELSEVKT